MITIVNAGIEPIDVPISLVLQYTNCARKDQACSLLEMAIATSSLQMVVIANDHWKSITNSTFRGIPIINAETMLQPIVPSLVGEKTCFPTTGTATVDDITYTVHIHVDPEPVTLANGPAPVAQDFVLSSAQVELERAYKIRFALSSADTEEEIPRYWVGYFNASPRMSVPTINGFRKRKFTPCDEDDDI